ncbi:hypothetical protein L484_020302 [Morus notabilis]|uniref:Uncharacterized protein n=1 Tax=Morus notabilis TaxID=981085 RepID=W9R302_9ROSA|nr:hypothetical protein L484_020302 [Morus notabilis]
MEWKRGKGERERREKIVGKGKTKILGNPKARRKRMSKLFGKKENVLGKWWVEIKLMGVGPCGVQVRILLSFQEKPMKYGIVYAWNQIPPVFVFPAGYLSCEVLVMVSVEAQKKLGVFF